MKKLLVLALVLAVAGIVNAGLVFDDVTGKVSYSSEVELVGGINVYVGSADLTAADFINFVGRTNGAPTSAPAFTAYTGEDAVANSLPWIKGFTQISWGDAVIAPNPAGFWFSFDVPAGLAKIVTIDVMDANTGVIESVVTPEPMTMLLLGLGGLFIRRK